MTYSIEQRDEQLVNTAADITYAVMFDRAAQHLVTITMRIDAITTESIVAVMPSWSPGSYKIRDYIGWQGNVEVHAVQGANRTPLTYSWRDKASLVVSTQGATSVEISYVVYGNERTVRTNHINRNHAFLQPPAVFMYVEGRTQEIHHVELFHNAAKWPSVSTALSPVRPGGAPGGGLLLGALNYDILADSPIELGDHPVRTFELRGARHEVALASNHTLDIDWLTQEIQRIVDVEAELFGGLPYDRYVFIIQVYPGVYGGLEHSRSSVNAVDPSMLLDKTKAKELLALLCHEYFHLWNIKRIRPVELGPFDYTREAYTTMLWLAEGMTSYYDDLLAYRCGFLTQVEYLDVLANEHFARLAKVPGRRRMSVRDSSFLAWVKLYLASPDGNNRFPSYYLKGGILFLLLDLYIIDHTDGKRTLDDGLRALWRAYQENPKKGLTEADVLAAFETATGVQLRDLFMGWLDGVDEIAYDDVLQAAGLRLQISGPQTEAITYGEKRGFAMVPPQLNLGWSVAEIGGRIVVRTVEDGGPAQRAGIGNDDEIVAVDGRRVTSTAMLDQYLQLAGRRDITLDAVCDGRTYRTTIRPDHVDTFKLVTVKDITSRQTMIRTVWLRRTI